MICMLANALAQKGYDVHLLSLNKPEEECYYPLMPAINWHKIGHTTGIKGKLSRIQLITGILKENKIDCLVGFVMSGDKTIYAAAKLAGIKLIAAERNAPDLYHIRYSWLQRWISYCLLATCDHITTQFPGFKNKYPFFLRQKITAIHNPVRKMPAQAQPAQPHSSGRFILLSVARFDPVQKCLDRLVKSFLKIADDFPQWDLHLVGDGPDKAMLEKLATEAHQAERIKFITPSNSIDHLYAEAHLFCLPSRWEGFPNSLAEALSAGLPAIGYANSSGVSDLIGTENGWLAAGNSDINTLSETLRLAINKPQERIIKGAQAQKNMHVFNQSDPVEVWLTLLKKVTGKSN